MKVIILAGGWGTRLGQQTEEIPKPMVPIGKRPILWHIMKIYSHYGFNDFIISLGVKAHVIKNYFTQYESYSEDFTIDMVTQKIKYHSNHDEKNWKVTLVDTGLNTLKGARIKRVEKYLDDAINMVTYGDGVSDININNLVEFHNSHIGEATMTVVRPPSRFGFVSLDGERVDEFEEKPQMQTGFINGGFFIFNKSIFNYLNDREDCDLEYGVLDVIAREKKLYAFKHNGFWQCMDNVRERDYLNKHYKEKTAPWILWE